MSSFSFLIPTLEHFRIFGYWIVLAAAFLESLAFVGLVIPGSLFIVFTGFLASRGYFDFGDLLWFAAFGAILGDAFSYYLGRRGKLLFRHEAKIFNARYLVAGQQFFKRHGGKSVFLGRFLGPVRPIIPFVAGASDMPAGTFFLWNVSSAFGWAFVHLLLGYVFGAAWGTIEVWTTRIGVAAAVAAAFFALLYALRRFIVRQGREVFGLVISVVKSIRIAVVTNPEAQRYVAKHPRLFAFARNRLERRHFFGLPLTLLAVAFLYLLSLLAGVVAGILLLRPITTVDQNIANLMLVFRDPTLTRVFLWVTAWGNWAVVGSVVGTVSIVWFITRNSAAIVGLWMAVIGGETFDLFGKWIIHRPRPPMAVYATASGSFPSSHATLTIVLYGFLTYVIARSAKTWKGKVNAVFLGVVVALAVGFSRMYLGVHYLSDIWGGYLIGLLWLIVGISVREWYAGRSMMRPGRPPVTAARVRWIIVGIVTAELMFGATYAANFQPLPASPVFLNPTVTANILKAFQDHQLPAYTETLSGTRQEPLSFVIVAPNDAALISAFRQSGWYVADPVNVSTVAALVGAALSNASYPTAPMTPSFWNNTVQDFGFEKPTATDTARQRHHARFWRATAVTPDGENLYVGTASLDVGVKWGITHQIDPNIDAERQQLLADLQAAGVVASAREVQFVPATLGKNFSGDPFFTDGKLWYVRMTD